MVPRRKGVAGIGEAFIVKHTQAWGFAAALGALAAGSGAAGAAPQGSFEVLPATGKVVVDGALSEWNFGAWANGPTVVISPEVSTARTAAIASDAANSAQVYLAYDAENLYVAAHVLDDNVTGDASGSGIWQNTALELWFNTGNLDVPATLEKGNDYEAGDYQFDLTPMSGGAQKAAYWVYPGDQGSRNDGQTVQVAAQVHGDGYDIEARIPLAAFEGWSALGRGTVIKFAASTVHIDKASGWDGLFSPGGFNYHTLTFE